jgi:anthranilate phosphoribosyltransferase
LLNTLLAGQDLTAADTAWAMRQVMADDVEPVALAGFLVALRAKGETALKAAAPTDLAE